MSSLTERPGRIEAAAGELHANHLSDKQRQTNSHRCDESRSVFLGSKHVDGEDQLGSENCLNENTLSQTCAARESRSHVEVLGKEVADEHRGQDAAEHLRKEQAHRAYHGDGTNQDHGEGDGWVEEATADTEEYLVGC